MTDTNNSVGPVSWTLDFNGRKNNTRKETEPDGKGVGHHSETKSFVNGHNKQLDANSGYANSKSNSGTWGKKGEKGDKHEKSNFKLEKSDDKSGKSDRSRRPVDEGGRSADDVKQVRRFDVILKNNHGNTYHPGQYVEGHVQLELQLPVMTRGIFLHFRGHGNIYWTEQRRGQGGRCVDTVEFQAPEDYFNVRNILHDPGLLGAGVYEFPFRFHLTPPTPDTYSDNLCEIGYFLDARVKQDTLTRNDIRARRNIQVVTPLDLNEQVLPDVTLPVQCQMSRTLCCWCCSSPPIIAFLRLCRSGYAPGETIVIQADIENNSSRGIKATHYRLVQVRVYKTRGKALTHRDIIGYLEDGPVNGRETHINKDVSIPVPKQQLFNVTASRIFSISYVIEMEVIPRRSLTNLKLSARVVLGAIPLKGKTLDVPTHLRLAPHAQHKRPTVKEIEARKKRTELKRNEGRERRKVRNQKVTPTEDTDESDYVISARDKVADGLYMK